MSKDNLRASPRPITIEGNLQDYLCLSNLQALLGFMLRQPISPAMLELPLSRDLDLDHKLELHCSSLHHTKMQVRSIKSNSSFQNKHTTSQIVEQLATYFSSVVLRSIQDFFLQNQEITPNLILKQHLRVLFLSMELSSQYKST